MMQVDFVPPHPPLFHHHEVVSFIIIDPIQTSFVKSLFSVLSINLTYVDEER